MAEESINISAADFKRLLYMVEQIYSAFKDQPSQVEKFIDNQEFIIMLGISKRTARTWREKNLIPFSQVGYKFYYKLSDVQQLLSSNYGKPFKRIK
jgi:hypothetical protein